MPGFSYEFLIISVSWIGTGIYTYASEPPYTERYLRWCGRTAIQLTDSLLPNLQIQQYHGTDAQKNCDEFLSVNGFTEKQAGGQAG